MIPKKIHHIFFGENKLIHPVFVECIKRAIEIHPSWKFQVYNEDDAERILKEHLPEFWTAYEVLAYDVQRVDFLRIILVYLYGGFYLDLDVYCLKSLDDLLDEQLVLGEEKTISDEEQATLGLQNKLRVANFAFGGVPRHEFWLSVIKLLASRANIPVSTQQDIVDITGPGLLTDLYHDLRNSYPEIRLLRNTTLLCATKTHNEISCHFGDYAAHLHVGTWRGQIK